MDYNDECKYRFTSYLMISLKNARSIYCEKLRNKLYSEVMFDSLDQDFGAVLCYKQNFTYNFKETKTILDLDFDNEFLSETLHSLSKLDQEILTLKFIEGLQNREIASKINLTKDAVDKRYQRIIFRIREEVNISGEF